MSCMRSPEDRSALARDEGRRRHLYILWRSIFDPFRAHENIFARRQAPGNVLTHCPVSHLFGAFQYRSYSSHSKVNGWQNGANGAFSHLWFNRKKEKVCVSNCCNLWPHIFFFPSYATTRKNAPFVPFTPAPGTPVIFGRPTDTGTGSA